MKTTNLLTLPGNRQLAYAECGDPNGHPVILSHRTSSLALLNQVWGCSCWQALL